MTAVSPSIENLIVPILGLCILLPLFAAAYLEPKKDYSRRTFISMLYATAGILVSELFQWIMDSGTINGSAAAMQIIMTAFFCVIVLQCYFWTIYSFYWFNGYPPGHKAVLGFAAGPAAGALMLAVNIITGSVYTVAAGGGYTRGILFAPFIAFCYSYLVISIIVTALLAAKRRSIKREHGILMFILFIIFPLLGPIAQYLMPSISLMGITQSVALLTVYVSIQQLATAQYAAESAHMQDETLEYERSLERLLSDSADSLCVFRLNLTRDTRSGERGIPAYIMKLCRGGSVDDLFGAFACVISDFEELALFQSTLKREALLAAFDRDETQVSLRYHRRVDNGETHLISVSLSMLKNPSSGDVEAIVYSVDIDRQEKEEKVIFAITDREYDYIILIDAASEKIHYQYSPMKPGAAVSFPMGDYDSVMERAVATMSGSGDLEFEQISFDTVTSALAGGDEYNVVFSLVQPDGEARQKRITYRYLDEKKSEILFFRSDITEEMRQERERSAILQDALEKAQRADAMKTEFLSNVSHDMRTPLNAVLGYANLAREAENRAQVTEYLSKIDKAGNILLSLVNDTLDLSKIESGEITLKPQPIQYGEVVKKAEATIAPLAEKKNVRLIIDESRAARVPICVDALRLQEIVLNLLSNAVKFTPPGGQVFFSVECVKLDDDVVHDKVTVRDTGCGMKPDYIPKMFEPFSQERQTADTEGSGLGLSIVKKLVDLMGGRIEVNSEPGRGTEFTVWLDIKRAQLPPKAPEQVSGGGGELRGRRVLLAEDNAMNTEIARAILASRGIETVCAENGSEACRIFAASAPGDIDAVLMDIRMPVMNGYDAARAIRAMDRPDAASVPIVAMSADAFDDDIRACLDAGMNGHVAKPIVPELLFEKLSDAMDGKSGAPDIRKT